jgi:uncharacterized protein YodC (DUF2158 family)
MMKRGDTVRLKAKIGPPMVVLKMEESGLVLTTWFTTNNEVKNSHFGKDLLEVEKKNNVV